MKTVLFSLTMLLACAESSSYAAPQPRDLAKLKASSHARALTSAGTLSAPRANPVDKTPQGAVLWTNDEVEKLGRGRSSAFTSLPDARAEAANTAIAEARNPSTVYVRATDPVWYTEQEALLQAKLRPLEADIAAYRAELQAVRDNKRMEAGIAIYQDPMGITPEAGLEVRGNLLRQLRSQQDDLRELARRNNIRPGIVRE